MLSLLLSACAIRSTVALVKVEEPMHDAQEAGAEQKATYEYVMAEQYRLKAHEEWGYASWQDAEALAKKSATYAGQAKEVALYGEVDADYKRNEGIDETFEGAEDVVPDKIERKGDAPPVEDPPIDLGD